MKYVKDLIEMREKSNENKVFGIGIGDIFISVTEEEVGTVEMVTRQQSKSNLWYRFRSGRITASKMKSVCSTDSSNLSQVLLMFPLKQLHGD
jgi:hypothetical protein